MDTLIQILGCALVAFCVMGIAVVFAILEIPFKTLLGFKQEKNWWER